MYSSFNLRTIIRFLAIAILTIVLASVVPSFATGDVLSFLRPIPIATIFAILVAFYINDALAREKAINTNVAIELSRIRRVFHLSKGFSTPGLKKWAKDLREKDLDYIKSFGSHDFGEYHKTNKAFREISYHIYQLDPKILKTPKEISLYNELLTTTREWAMVRQSLQELKKQNISLYNWVILLSISAILIFALMLMRTEGIFTTKLVSGLTIVSVLFTLDLLWEINYISKQEKRRIARRYLFNLDKLQIDMPDKEGKNKE